MSEISTELQGLIKTYTELYTNYNKYCEINRAKPEYTYGTSNLQILAEQYDETSNYFERLSPSILASAIKKLFILGAPIDKIPTACGRYCYLLKSSALPNQPKEGHILFIPYDVEKLGLKVAEAIRKLCIYKTRVRRLLGNVQGRQIAECYFTNLKIVGGEGITDIGSLFNKANAILDICDFSPKKLRAMRSTFLNFHGLVDISYLDTSNVEVFNHSFSGTNGFSIKNIDKIDTSSAIDMIGTFAGYVADNIPIFDTSKVKNMHDMFNSCYTHNFKWVYNTDSCTDISRLFAHIYIDKLDLTELNINEDTEHEGIFNYADGCVINAGNKQWIYDQYANRKRCRH